MSRITGSEAKSLMEAYNAVYASQELTEEQIWEEVENWVNSLVEEGYDLSEYTWEDMYEAYLSEMGQPGARTTGQNSSVFAIKTTPGAGSAADSGSGGRRGSRGSSSTSVMTTKTAPTKPTPSKFGTTTPRGSSVTSTGVSGLSSADRAAYSAGGGNAAAQKGMGRTTAQVIAQGKANLGRMDQSRPAPSSAKPTSGGSTVHSTTGLSAGPAKAVTSSAAVKAAPSLSPSTSGSLTKPTASIAAKPATSLQTAAPKQPSISSGIADLRKMRMASQMRQSGANVTSTQLASFDMFDVVKAHLLDEGYADTEEAALAIMANMSEEWRESIVESGYRGNSGGTEPETVGGRERPGVPGETYKQRQKRMRPSSQVKDA